jgi:NADP-dependent 3-hydroxy acid dehydrogenase YdfG
VSSDRPVGIITGAASGIGAATAVEFARTCSAQLVLGILPGQDASDVVRAVRDAGGDAKLVEADVRSPEECLGLAETAVTWGGQIDFVYANAGVADQSTIAGGDPARWRWVVETNLLGTAFTVRAALPAMIERRSGHIFITASTSGRESYVGEPMYIASKWGLVGFGHAARKELSHHGIRVTLIEPGIVDSPLTRNAPAVAPMLTQSIPLQPDDVARAVVYAFGQPLHVNVSELTVEPVKSPEVSDVQLTEQ